MSSDQLRVYLLSGQGSFSSISVLISTIYLPRSCTVSADTGRLRENTCNFLSHVLASAESLVVRSGVIEGGHLRQWVWSLLVLSLRPHWVEKAEKFTFRAHLVVFVRSVDLLCRWRHIYLPHLTSITYHVQQQQQRLLPYCGNWPGIPTAGNTSLSHVNEEKGNNKKCQP